MPRLLRDWWCLLSLGMVNFVCRVRIRQHRMHGVPLLHEFCPQLASIIVASSPIDLPGASTSLVTQAVGSASVSASIAFTNSIRPSLVTQSVGSASVSTSIVFTNAILPCEHTPCSSSTSNSALRVLVRRPWRVLGLEVRQLPPLHRLPAVLLATVVAAPRYHTTAGIAAAVVSFAVRDVPQHLSLSLRRLLRRRRPWL